MQARHVLTGQCSGRRRKGARGQWTFAGHGFRSAATAVAPVKVGDHIPLVVVFAGAPGNKVTPAKNRQGSCAVWSPNTHLPEFVECTGTLKAKEGQGLACLDANVSL